ncbi:MAG: hypothetical protein IT245_03335 [Bacteroidia bacterium]|nr:hypothetical protein [Bacteroidia bacterium]
MSPLFKSFITLCVLAILFTSCDKEQEVTPAYLHLTKFSFSSDPNSQGLGTSEIIGAKVFVNGAEIGNFELPVTIPVLSSGNSIVEVFPNIKENGVSSNQKYYKPYNSYVDTLMLAPGRIDTIRPSSTYRTNCKFEWIEDFEDQAISLIESGLDNTLDSIVVLPTNTPGVDQPFAGSNYCGFISIPEDTSVIFERSTLRTFTVPNLGTSVYVELDIKTNLDVQIGIYSDDNIDIIQSPVMVVYNTKGNWKKIYVNLASETGDLSTNTKIRVFIGTYKENGDTEDKYIYLDNLKLVYLQ